MNSTPSDFNQTPEDLEEIIVNLVISTLGKPPGFIKANDPLFSSKIGFDSFSLMEFVLRLEDTFGLTIPDQDLDLDIFYSAQTVKVYIQARLGELKK